MSVVSLDISEGFVNLSVCECESHMILSNKSCLTACVVSRATFDAILFAITLKTSASTEHINITTPQKNMFPCFPSGITVSIIYAKIQGRHKSIIVPINFITNPNAIRA